MQKNSNKKSIFHVALLLGISALAGTGAMALTYNHAKDLIKINEEAVLKRSLNNVLSAGNYNNDIVNDKISVTAPDLLGSKKPLTIYRARLNGVPVAAAMTAIAPNGYSGPIKLLVGVNYSGQIIGVRVVEHRETPGLGDGIEPQRSNWILAFDKRSLTNTSKLQWQVKKDGGVIDQLTGATITPRAVIKAVYLSLQYFDRNKNFIFSSAAPQSSNMAGESDNVDNAGGKNVGG